MRIDWHRVAENIKGVGRGAMAQASDVCGMEEHWVSQLRRGKATEPTFACGLELLKLHLRWCGKAKHREVIKR